MAANNSIQHKLDRVRPPRVQITYDVQTGGAIEKRELPLVVGVIADLTHQQTDPETNKPLVDPFPARKFVAIDRDNFDDVLEKAKPTLRLSKQGLTDTEEENVADFFPVTLKFSKIDDFAPFAIVSRVQALSDLYDARTRLADLAAKIDGNQELRDALTNAIKEHSTELEALPAIEGDTAPAAEKKEEA